MNDQRVRSYLWSFLAGLALTLGVHGVQAAITDCEGMSVDGQAQCIPPNYSDYSYWVCDIAGSYLYRDYAWQYCQAQMGLTAGAPITSEGTAIAYADCFDRRLQPSGSGVTGPVPWLPVGTLYHDFLCVNNSYVRAMNGQELMGFGNLNGSSSSFVFSRRKTATCPSGYSPSIYINQYGASDIYRCKQNLTCNPDQELRNGVCLTKVRIDKTADCLTCDAKVGNPIYPLVGVKAEDIATGFSLAGVDLIFHYDTTRKLGVPVFGNLPTLGKLWSSSLHKSLLIGSGAATITAHRGNGAMTTFVLKNGVYVADANVIDSVVSVDGTYRYTDAKQRRLEIYNAKGQLTSVQYATGGGLSFVYSSAASSTAPAAGYLMRVTDHQGRTLKFEYTLPAGTLSMYEPTAGLISRVTNASGEALVAGYDAYSNLATLTWPDGKTQQFLYENIAFPRAMTGRIDENSQRQSTWTYDANGLAIGTNQNLGTHAHSVTYALPPRHGLLAETVDASASLLHQRFGMQPPVDTQVTGPGGQAVSWKSTTILDRQYLTEVGQPAGSGSGASFRAASYDAAANVISRDDFDGMRTCYVYDSSNREVTRVEGLASSVNCSAVTPVGATLPPGARKTTTTWHPDWRLPVQISEPLKRTTNVYHGQPDPFNGNTVASCTTVPSLLNGKPAPVRCKQVEQARLSDGSIDATITAKVLTYTYDADGRILTITDEVGRVTNYGYYSETSFSSNPAGSFDQDYDRVVLLLRGNGLDGSTAVTDESLSGRSITAAGNAKIATAQSKFGGASFAFDGAGDYLNLANGGIFMEASDFTIEMWIYKNGNNPNGSYLWQQYYMGYYAADARLMINAAGNLVALGTYDWYWGWNAWSYIGPAIPNGVWTHVALVRSGGGVKLYVNGVGAIVSTTLSNKALYTSGGANHVGGQPVATGSPDTSFNGYIDDLRITKGKARYTANFLPSTYELPAREMVRSMAEIGHSAGDLQSITNPAGHVTQFTQYDQAGRVRQMIDPKGVVTDITYTPRGWVSTVTTTAPGASARTTSYSYDGVGQMTGVSHPDGTTLGYTYDAAHRLVGITDAKGNSISYTLDNAGNKVSEEIKDPSGVLQRSISRSYDALNRVQQVTGAAQ